MDDPAELIRIYATSGAKALATKGLFTNLERTNIGERASDAAAARNISRELDQAIDKVFPPMRTVLNQAEAAKRKESFAKKEEALSKKTAGPLDRRAKLETRLTGVQKKLTKEEARLT